MAGKAIKPKGEGKIWTQAIRRALAHQHGTVDRGLLALAKRLVTSAEGGDQWAMQHIAERLEGKVKEQVHVEGDIQGVRVDDARSIAQKLRQAAVSEASYTVIDESPEPPEAGIH